MSCGYKVGVSALINVLGSAMARTQVMAKDKTMARMQTMTKAQVMAKNGLTLRLIRTWD